ncbi:MaoC/PaaZ C-terminal domain-containing protein [Albidovulum sp.]|uniref:MaoC/PaaZ C-terminal domain-containing protein n=1 Tax=Albidovulum sp. TaxID=1872424 RepID=UPI0039B911CC
MTGQPWFDDLYPGYRVSSAPRRVERDEIIAFARDWDPQPFHIDADLAKASAFGQLVASGVHMHALMMRLGFDSNVLTGHAEIGLGLDGMRFLHPLLPGATIRAVFTVLDLRPSASRPEHGVVRWQTDLVEEGGPELFTARLANLYRRRGTG